MLKKSFLLPAVLVLAGLLASADFAMAQNRGSRGGSRSNVSSGTVNRGTVNRGTWNGNRGTWNGNRYYNNGYYGNRYSGNYYNRGYGYGWPYYSGYYYPGYAYSYPYVNTYPYSSYYSDPYAAYDTPAPTYYNSVASAASVEVIVPDPNATVWFDGSATTQTGTDRWFQTPALTGNASYTIRASWNDGGRIVTRDKSVTVSPGQTSVVNFTY